MSQRFIRIAVVYLAIGALLGFAMGIAGTFTLAPIHAHLALAGWVSLALAGVIYHLYPPAGETRLAKAHFWLHNVGLPVFMGGLAFVLTGNDGLLPVVVAGGTLLLLGLVLFSVNVLRHVKTA